MSNQKNAGYCTGNVTKYRVEGKETKSDTFNTSSITYPRYENTDTTDVSPGSPLRGASIQTKNGDVYFFTYYEFGSVGDIFTSM